MKWGNDMKNYKNKKGNKNQSVDITQFEMGISKSNYLDNVIGTIEACEILKIDKSYLRKLVAKGEFESWEYKDIGRFKIFLKSSIEDRKNKFKRYKKEK